MNSQQKRGANMSRIGDQFIEETGGFRINDAETLTPAHGERIRAIEERIKSGKLSLDEVEEQLQLIRKLKGIVSDEWESQQYA
jgi:NifB/MoaA-like Fe-S oxidoreductase